MASNANLVEFRDRGRLNGLEALWRKENHSWWGTRSWLVKMITWIVVLDGMLVFAAFESAEPLEQTALTMYFLLAATLPTFGVIVLGQEMIIEERRMGTAAWVLSKPVSRASFILSKMSADALGVLATMVLAPGFVAYFIYKAATGISLSIPGFLAGLGLIYLFLISVLALTLMLGTLFHAHGPLIGISMAFVFGNIAAVFAPGLGKVAPSHIFFDTGSGHLPLAVAMAQGQPLPTMTPVISTGILIVLFIIIALVRFEREEF